MIQRKMGRNPFQSQKTNKPATPKAQARWVNRALDAIALGASAVYFSYAVYHFMMGTESQILKTKEQTR